MCFDKRSTTTNASKKGSQKVLENDSSKGSQNQREHLRTHPSRAHPKADSG